MRQSLQQLFSNVGLAGTHEQLVDVAEGAAVVVEVQHFVAVEVVIHAERLLELLRQVDALVLLEVLLVQRLCQEVGQRDHADLLNVHVVLDLAGHLATPEYREHAAHLVVVEHLLRLVIELVERDEHLVLSKDRVEDCDCVLDIDALDELVAGARDVVKQVQLFLHCDWALENQVEHKVS